MHLPRVLTITAAIAAAIIIGGVGYLLLRPPVPLLSNATFESALISPNADGQDDITFITYTLARPAQVSITLERDDGEHFVFRESERRVKGDYRVAFSGIVGGYSLPGEDIPGAIETRLIPNGQYTWTITAANDDETAGATGSLEVVAADTALPIIRSFEISPDVFSPNQDGIGDRVNVNVYLEKEATLNIYLEDENGQQIYLPEREGGRAQGEAGNHEYDYDGGVDQDLQPPPDGTYRVFAVAQDAEGQRIVRERELTLVDGGLPQVEIVAQTTGATVVFSTQPYDPAYYFDAATQGERIPRPEGVTPELTSLSMPQGELLVFYLTVENYGTTPIRTAGPFPGTVYEFGQIMATMGEYRESGAWRVGINCETVLSDFPWRWALGTEDELTHVEDEVTGETYYYLEPGQRAHVWGAIRMTELIPALNPQDCWAGLIHESVEVTQAQVGRRPIQLLPAEGTITIQ